MNSIVIIQLRDHFLQKKMTFGQMKKLLLEEEVLAEEVATFIIMLIMM
jgi:hypothetical protein